ncbi:hypothetical protein EDL79_02975 [Ehrlichia ruminantium]|uniref:Uncharacterized protein n=1 Tax=Ehrlichia ruminantium TaxID=779 RepID=A0AAE6QA93_EHRRU|nr:hypothetical protein [Ehrlichia ruminantium]QGR02595.1 hypothetical protein EDL81_02965 [Ehrlichia ruminantium]QGR03514.1 hypothetical protein EDL80_02965 [Ehrlichia ruminantium]QGR04441.1 hypothetical protein EDL79_02975 [Ehrlichia ruminantium]
MVDNSNKLGTRSHVLDDLKKCSEAPNSIVDDVVLLELGSSDGDDFKALAKIKLEDLDTQETMLELEKQFDMFILEQAGGYNVVQESGYDGTHDYSISNIVGYDEDFEVDKSLLQKILDFFIELSQSSEEDISLEYELDPLNRKRKKKKFILQSIIEFLKRLLRDSRRLNLKQLLEQQILELQEKLSKELDPDLRKLLQERLILLTQLRAQLIEKGITSSLLINYFLISSLISSIIRSHGEASVAVQERESLLHDLSKALLSQQKDQGVVKETVASSLQVFSTTSCLNILNIQGYISDVFHCQVKEVSSRLYDQYYNIHRDHISGQPGPNVGMFAAVYAIMRMIDHAMKAVKDFVVKTFHNLNKTEVPTVTAHEPHVRVFVKSESAPHMKHKHVESRSYACSCTASNQQNMLHAQYAMGYMSSYSYYSECKVTSVEMKNSSYLKEIKVEQMHVQSYGVSQSVK